MASPIDSMRLISRALRSMSSYPSIISLSRRLPSTMFCAASENMSKKATLRGNKLKLNIRAPGANERILDGPAESTGVAARKSTTSGSKQLCAASKLYSGSSRPCSRHDRQGEVDAHRRQKESKRDHRPSTCSGLNGPVNMPFL